MRKNAQPWLLLHQRFPPFFQYMEFTVMKIAVILFFCLLSIMATGQSAVALAQDCAAAETLFYESEQASKFADRERALLRSLELCPSFQAAYRLATAYQKENRPSEALEACNRALDLADSDEGQALAMGRKGQLMAAEGKAGEALALLTEARSRHPQPPGWIEESMKGIELKQAATVMDARALTMAFADSKAFCVCPKVNVRINFALDRADLTGNGPEQLRQMGEALVGQLSKKGFTVVARQDSKKVLIIGHTDTQGDERYNQTLSERRAETVKNELERQYPQLAGKIRTEGHGESQPQYRGSSEEDHRLNRRVEFQILGE
jgi:outer membrane protein OmpA-like peptidoglycan-associated protein